MVSLWLLCFASNLTDAGEFSIDNIILRATPVNKRLCPQFDPDKDTTFDLYTRDNPSEPDVFKPGDKNSVKNSHINFENPTIIFFHGFQESSKSEDALKIKNNYLIYGKYNVILGNNKRLLAGPYYVTSSSNVEPIGKYSAMFVDFLVDQGLKLSDLHIIGMSLGAHIAGITGKNLKSGKASRITGLDPAGPVLDLLPPEQKLSKDDAEFVDAIHTNAGGLGTIYPSGDVDIWFNSGVFQPGCGPISTIMRKPFSIGEIVSCSHFQAWRIYVKSLMNPAEYPAVKCNSYVDYEQGKCDGNEKVYAGVNVNKTASGNYYIGTGVTAVDV